MKLKIKVKKLNKEIRLPHTIKVGEWVDLRASKSKIFHAPQAETLKKHVVNGETISHRDVSFDYDLIPLGVAMKLPDGFEAIVAPRSSTFKKYKVIQANSIGVIDNSYSSDTDEWMYPVISLGDTEIPEGDRICQFRIQLSQRATVWQKLKWLFTSDIEFVEVNCLSHEERGGFGSTGNI